LWIRARVLRALRETFERADFLEIETPVRIAAPALEQHIDAEPSGTAYLRTSPELHMKRLLAAGRSQIFQIGPCFRRGEYGPLHRPEYTLLEWYRAGTDYQGILADARDLIRAAATACGSPCIQRNGVSIDWFAEWSVRTVSEIFLERAGWDPACAWDADRFDLDLVEIIEPHLRTAGVPVVLSDYPAPAAALARLKPDDPLRAERWELYIGGVEIANAYSELTDPAEQRKRFAECATARAAAQREVYPMDHDFLAALDSGLPPSGGCALGIDRLAMILAGADTLDDVTAFRDRV
jgi:lysyl-tRNA synthetase class 2